VKRSQLQRLERLRRVCPLRRTRRARQQLQAFRAAVLAAAGHRCERCGAGGRLDAHHLLPRSRGGAHHASNGAALCSGTNGCHALVHRHEAADWQRWVVSGAGVSR
jgi:5-methylcytosine-specific restriction endonuclease McrA